MGSPVGLMLKKLLNTLFKWFGYKIVPIKKGEPNYLIIKGMVHGGSAWKYKYHAKSKDMDDAVKSLKEYGMVYMCKMPNDEDNQETIDLIRHSYAQEKYNDAAHSIVVKKANHNRVCIEIKRGKRSTSTSSSRGTRTSDSL